MRVSKFGWVGAAILMGTCGAAGAFAQDPAQPPAGGARRAGGQGRGGAGGFGQGGFGQGRAGGQMSLVTVPVDILAKELKLTDDQKTALKAAQSKYQTDLRASFQPPADGAQVDRQARQAKMQEITQTATKEIDGILKDDQKPGATALVKNLQLLQSLRIPFQTYSDLKITDEQKTKLTALAADSQKDRTAKMQEMQAARQAGDNEKAQQIMQSMFGNGQPDEKTLAVLTADQKEVITKYVKANPPRQGGRPGAFGPGAGAAPQP